LLWTKGQGVALSYNGAAPDVGAYEYQTPSVAIALAGTNVTLSWSIVGFTLQSSTNPASPAAWTNVTQTPVTNGSQISVVLSASTRQQFFRLANP